ncbi:MAG: glycosyltransferase family 2 protein [Bacteroidetes bacterium]|nr:glycosyltransferase family 2 protein [Bacteroidota bacterium]
MTLSIVIVNMNTWHVLQKCLRSVYRQTPDLDFEVIVVDNASSDGSPDRIRKEFQQVRLIQSSDNIGFAAANNRGLSIASGDYILLLNPDTEIRDQAILKVVRFMDSHPDVGIGGCKLVFSDGTIQQSLRSFPSVWNLFAESTFLYRLFPKTTLFGSYYMTHFDYLSTRQVDWLCGAFLMMQRALPEDIGFLDEQFYMYSEEIDYCYRAKQAGYTAWYFHEAEVVHHWGGVSAVDQRVVLWMHGSQLLYLKKHFRGLEKAVLVGMKYMAMLLRIVVYFVVGCLSFNPNLLKKSRYYTVAVAKLLTQRWEYVHDHTGAVQPWQV